MADVIRFSFHSLRFSSSSSLLTSVSSSLTSLQPGLPPIPNSDKRVYPLLHSSSSARDFARFAFTPRKQLVSLKVRATVTETNQPKWWERNAPNMVDIHSTQDFLSALSQAGERLVIVEFYGTWCASCRALFPKLCRTAEEHPEILFLKINFDENKPMCKSMNVKVLPYFHFYRGADGQLEAFSCSLAKTYKNDMIFLCFLATKSYTLKKEDEFQKIKDAIQTHSTARCSIGPPKGVGDLKIEPSFAPNDKPSGSTSA